MTLNDYFFDFFFQDNREFVTIDFGLDRISKAVSDIGIDFNTLGRVIHVAGTNGKGSTSYFIAQFLHNLGYKTALFTSPHIEVITERFKLQLKDISDDCFRQYFESLKAIIVENKLTFFEALTLIAYKMFSDFKPDVTILETGMGGRLDATNVVDEKIPVITTISQDHINFLGKDIYGIVDEKIAIVKGNPVFFVGKNKQFIIDYILKKMYDKKIYIIQDRPKVDFYVDPYCYNYSLAKSVVEYLLGVEIEDQRLALPPCRLERVGRFILDGSHNPNGLLSTLKVLDVDTAIFSCTRDRPVYKMIEILKKRVKHIILTEIPGNDRSIDVEGIKGDNLFRIKDPLDAIYKSIYISSKSDILITGSLYLCGFLRKIVADVR
ncbi:MAG: Mur ligase family protein [Calditerrivibrio sp.]|nr:Mur ligase family protein [Calditerrivibrio sp.]